MRSAASYRCRAAVTAASLTAAAATALLPSPALAAAGDLDPTFSADGRVTFDVGGCEDDISDIAQVPVADGALVAVGSTCRIEGVDDPQTEEDERQFIYSPLVTRVTSGGSPDATFGGGDGIVTTADDASGFRTVAVTAAGEIYAGGYFVDEAGVQNDLLVVRFSATGAELNRFRLHRGPAGSDDSIEDLRIAGDGTVSAAGTSCVYDEADFYDSCKVVAVRLSAALEPDTAYNGGSQISATGGFFPAVHLLTDNRVAAIDYDGDTGDDGLRIFTAAELAPDPLFSTDGMVPLSFLGVGLTSTGTHLFVVGDEEDNTNSSQPTSDQVVAKYALAGTPDTTFSGDGIVVSDLGDDEYASEIALDSSGNVYTAGALYTGAVATIARYLPTGVLDATFGEGGSARFSVPSFDDPSADALIVQLDGKPVVGGTAFDDATGNSDAFLARFKAATPNPIRYTPLTPARILDTRSGKPPAGDGKDTPFGPGATFNVPILGRGGVPGSGVGAVVLNVTAITPTTGGYLAAYPAGTAFPGTSNLNFVRNQVVANLVTVKLGEGGAVTLLNSTGTTHVSVDVAGYYSDGESAVPGGKFVAVSPARMLDSRPGRIPTNEGVNTKIGPGQEILLDVTGRLGVPASVSAVVLNLTVSEPSGPSYLTAYPSDASPPTVSNLNFTAGLTVANLAIVKTGPDGNVKIRNNTNTTHVLADVSGYFTAPADSGGTTGSFQPLTPKRILDTRIALGAPAGKIARNIPLTVQVAGRGRVPVGAKAVVMNVTAVAPTTSGHLTVYPADLTSPPTASNLNFGTGKTVPNSVIVKLSPDGKAKVVTAAGATHVIFDVAGWYN